METTNRTTPTIPLSFILAVLALLMAVLAADLPVRSAPLAATQTTVTLLPVADATTRSWQPDANFGSEVSLEISYGDGPRAAFTLLRFDVSGIPDGAVIDSAVLELYLWSSTGADPSWIGIYDVYESWDEQGVTWNTRPQGQTGGFVSGHSVDSSPGYKSWGVAGFVDAWRTGSNHGLELRGSVGPPTAYYERTFGSRDGRVNRPRLVLTYHTSSPPPDDTDTPTPTSTHTPTPTSTPTPTPTTTRTIPPEPAHRSFAGHIFQGGQGDRSRPLVGVRVALYGSDESVGAGSPRPGDLLAHARTGSDGMFYLADLGAERVYPYYSLVLDHPSVIVTSVVPGIGGVMRGANWIEFPGPTPGDWRGSEWYLETGAQRLPVDSSEPVPDRVDRPAPSRSDEPPIKPEPIDLKVDGVELTQAIQCFDTAQGDANCPDNSLPLVAGKLTAARVYISRVGPQPPDPQYPKVRVDLYIRIDYEEGGGAFSKMAVASQQFTVPLKWQRTKAYTTANFLIGAPEAGTLTAWAQVNAAQVWPDPNPANDLCPAASVQVVDTHPVPVAWTRVNYQPQPKLSTKYPNHPYKGLDLANEGWVTGYLSQAPWFVLPTAKIDYHPSVDPIIDYYVQVWEQGQLIKLKNDVRDDYKGTSLAQLFLKDRLVSLAIPVLGSQPFHSLFAWFPAGAFDQHESYGMAEGSPPVTKDKGRTAFGTEPHLGVMIHETGHNLGLGHYPCSYNPPNDPHRHNWPSPYDACSPVEVSFNPLTMNVEDSYTFMTYAGHSISPVEWQFLVDRLKVQDSTAANLPQPSESSILVASGWLSREGDGWLDPIYTLQGSADLPDAPPGARGELLLLDNRDRVLARHPFEPQFQALEVGETSLDFFHLRIPAPTGTWAARLLYDGITVAERRASATRPGVAFLSPQPGEALKGTVRLTWQAMDGDGDPLHYRLFYSHDGGTTWWPLPADPTAAAYDFDAEASAGGEGCYFRLLASDGWHTAEAVSGPFTIGRKPPLVIIGSPADGQRVHEEQTLVLTGWASDPEDGSLPDEALHWESDRDGSLGAGGTLILPGLSLSPGRHTLTLRAADADGLTGAARASIFVGQWLYLPVLSKGGRP